MMSKAVGTFHVKINSLPPYNGSAEAKLARMSIDKEFHGDIQRRNGGVRGLKRSSAAWGIPTRTASRSAAPEGTVFLRP